MATLLGDIKVRLTVERQRMEAELDEIERKAAEKRDRLERGEGKGAGTDSEASQGGGSESEAASSKARGGGGGFGAAARFPVESIIAGPITGGLRLTQALGIPGVSPVAGRAADLAEKATRFAEFGAPVARGIIEGSTQGLPDFMRDQVRGIVDAALDPILDRINQFTAFERSVSPALQAILPIAQVGAASGRVALPGDTLRTLEGFREIYEAQIKVKLRASQLATEANATAFSSFFGQLFTKGF